MTTRGEITTMLEALGQPLTHESAQAALALVGRPSRPFTRKAAPPTSCSPPSMTARFSVSRTASWTRSSCASKKNRGTAPILALPRLLRGSMRCPIGLRSSRFSANPRPAGQIGTCSGRADVASTFGIETGSWPASPHWSPEDPGSRVRGAMAPLTTIQLGRGPSVSAQTAEQSLGLGPAGS